ncbi:hypothetical protein [Sediminibacillus massiliensis]|uniref:hypothetical protein n=1 Tax=Sediminibacillus massiliensis TaxID=1926277 RepID=UPI000988435D|nr:hypothetical protein [Sediminibacillus massiliensis]
MFEVLFELPMNLQFYICLMSALLPLSLHIAKQMMDGPSNSYTLLRTSNGCERSLVGGVQVSQDCMFDTIICCITTCIKRKDAPDSDNDDHHTLLVV